MACELCYNDYISCGNDTIHITGTLTANTDYWWIITTPSGSKYEGDETTDADGYFTIDISDTNTNNIPPGLFNPYAGIFTLEVILKTDNDILKCNAACWNDSAYCDKYCCISFEVVNGNQVKNNIGCPCDLI